MKKLVFILFLLISNPTINLFAIETKCKYTYNPQATKLEWTAFKFTDRVGVTGTFDRIQVHKDKKNSSTILEAMRGANFSILTSSIHSGVPDRDNKIKEYFFGSSNQAKRIRGSFQDINGVDQGSSTLNLNFNGVRKSIPVGFSINEDVLEVKGKLDMADFKMLPGINKLNEICKELHTGKDGESKLWSDVEFKIISEFTKKCK